jgi:2-dehydropantoate 2-reductase
MRILVFGAGVLGSLYAGQLAAARQDVALLARRRRLEQLRRNGLMLLGEATGREAKPLVKVVEDLRPEDDYDLVLVVVREEQTADALPVLAANRHVPCFLFLHNRASGPEALTAALGQERVLLGFPGAGGVREGALVRYRLIREQRTTLGELNGRITPRLYQIAATLRSAGFPVVLSGCMDAWLKTHALFITIVAGAIYAAGGSCAALAASPDGVPDMVRAMRQGFRALQRQGTAIEPRKLAALFLWLPLLAPITYWRRYLARPEAEVIFGRRVQAAAGEKLELVNRLRAQIRNNPASTPHLDRSWAAVEQQALSVKRIAEQERVTKC